MTAPEQRDPAVLALIRELHPPCMSCWMPLDGPPRHECPTEVLVRRAVEATMKLAEERREAAEHLRKALWAAEARERAALDRVNELESMVCGICGGPRCDCP